jgi:hypothetical protein
MASHRHDWQPWPLLRAKYRCNCGAVGMRIDGGRIVSHRAKQSASSFGLDARPTRPSRKPTLDVYDRRSRLD